jgi:hypothetical protein
VYAVSGTANSPKTHERNTSSNSQERFLSHILLTGAGFSRNWGGWLANEAFEYMMGEFGLDEATVRRLLEILFELYNRHDPRDVAMTDGGFDGVARLQDSDASRLLAHFGYDSGAPVSQEQLQAFRTFHDRDRFSSSQK